MCPPLFSSRRSILLSVRSCGTRAATNPTTPSNASPPNTTDGTVQGAIDDREAAERDAWAEGEREV